jgi:hypothetical protein
LVRISELDGGASVSVGYLWGHEPGPRVASCSTIHLKRAMPLDTRVAMSETVAQKGGSPGSMSAVRRGIGVDRVRVRVRVRVSVSVSVLFSRSAMVRERR